jgi:hypothetical protein
MAASVRSRKFVCNKEVTIETEKELTLLAKVREFSKPRKGLQEALQLKAGIRIIGVHQHTPGTGPIRRFQDDHSTRSGRAAGH